MTIKVDKLLSFISGVVVAGHYFGFWGVLGWIAIYHLVGDK